jgi:5'-3' exonuclease
MGINGLSQYLKKKHPSVYVERNLREYGGKKIAVDTSLYVHKYKHSSGDRWLNGILNFIVCLRRNDIHPIFVFDGVAPPEKNSERERRSLCKDKIEDRVFFLEENIHVYHTTGVITKDLKEYYTKMAKNNRKNEPKRLLLLGRDPTIKEFDISDLEKELAKLEKQVVSITRTDFDAVRSLLTVMGIPYVDAPLEGETMCAAICAEGKAYAVLTEDTDVLAYGTERFLSKIDVRNNTVLEVVFSDLLEEMDLTKEEFIDFCIMCGTDYNPNIHKVGVVGSYKNIKKFSTIERIRDEGGLDVTILNHERGRELFTPPRLDFEVQYCDIPNIDKILKYLSDRRINISEERLLSAIAVAEVEFE